MNYYEMKKNAVKDIVTITQQTQGIYLLELQRYIKTKYGLSNNFVLKEIKELELFGSIKYNPESTMITFIHQAQKDALQENLTLEEEDKHD